MNVTSIYLKPVNAGRTLKASGNIELDKVLSLSFLVLEGVKGPFVSWKGTESYDKKDGSGKGYSSPIFIKDETLKKEVDDAILNKYKLEVSNTGNQSANTDSNPLSDQVPF